MTDSAEGDWGPLVDGLALTRAISGRIATDTVESIPKAMLVEYESAGWVKERELKTRTRVRRRKPHDVLFEDRVWATFAKLGFKLMNAQRNFRIPYGSAANERKQIDVFAVDDEVVLIIECKSTNRPQSATFKDEVEAYRGISPGIVKRVRAEYPGRKVRFILATNNYVLTNASRERVGGSELLHMSEDVINYYYSLAEHLGPAAKYQLLGTLFAGTKIPSLDTRVAAIQCKMAGQTYYSFSIEPERLLKLSYILHRNKANSELMPTYQRLIRKSRLQKVSSFVESGGFFPNSLVININTGSGRLRFERAAQDLDGPKLGVLHLPQTYRAAYVIDGQHRLYGYANSTAAKTDLIPVVAFVNLDRSEQVQMFMQINENQQAVPKNLRNTLNADLLWDSSDLTERLNALRLRIAQSLGEHKLSPLFERIIVGEEKQSNLRCITIDSIRLGLSQGTLLGQFTSSEIKELGTFHTGNNDSTYEAVMPFLFDVLRYFTTNLEEQFALGKSEGGFVFINSGVQSILRITSDIVDHLVFKEVVTPRRTASKEVFAEALTYLEPIVLFLKTLPSEEAIDMRRLYGSAGRTRYWRRLQQAVHQARPDFDPPGLSDFAKEEAREYNTVSYGIIRDIEQYLKSDVRRRLEDEYGASWFKKGVPEKVQISATTLALKKNLEREDEDEVQVWDCLHLIDYHEIATRDHATWQKLFADSYTRPGERQLSGGWRTKLHWLVELNTIRNENAHSYVVTEDQYHFLCSLKDWLLGDGGVEH